MVHGGASMATSAVAEESVGEEGMDTREREGPRGSAWRRPEASGRAGREEVEASGAQASTRLCLLAEVEDNRSGQWAGPSSWLHQVSGPGGLLLYFNFCSVFLYLIFLTLFF